MFFDFHFLSSLASEPFLFYRPGPCFLKRNPGVLTEETVEQRQFFDLKFFFCEEQ